jgi:hypothetical protein
MYIIYVNTNMEEEIIMFTIEEIKEAWKQVYGEDMQDEYPGFFKQLEGDKDEEIIRPGI